MFSVTPEPAVSKSAYDPQARQARADQPPSDDFAALVDSNAAAASETDRPARPAPDAPRRDARGTGSPAQSNDRPQADASATSSNKESGAAKQDAQSSAAADAAGNTSTDKTKAASDTKTEDKPQDGNGEGDAAAAAMMPVIPAIVTDPVAVVIAAAAAPTATGDETASATTVAATAAIGSASAVTTSADASAAQTPRVAETNTTGATVTTGVTTPAVETTAPETAAATISAAATVIKSDSGKTEILAKDGEAAPAKDGKDSKLAADPSAKPVSDQAIKPEAGAANTDDKPAQHDKAASGTADTESSKHAGKAAPQAEHQAAAPTPQQTLLNDPGLLPPTGIQPQPIQTHAANLTAIPVPTANTALADSAPVPLNGLAADIALRAAGGNSRFDIRLDPAELGRIDVRLDVDKHGNVTSHLTVERPATLDMLRNDAPRLQQALEDAGLKTGDSGLQFSLRDQSSSGRDSDNGSGRNSQRVVIIEEDTVPAQVAGRTYGRMLGASSGVDIRI
ncbi:MAG: flagellar hook-length control protein FliK [Afipia sp.]|nr:flagellar hook-length control protein FliK [Afipia sp.]